MRRSALLLLLSLALAAPLLGVAGVARADDAAVAEAQARFNEGLALADAGHHEEARLKFQQAAAVLKAPSVLYNLARSEQLTGHEYEAVEHFTAFLRGAENDPRITDAMREKAKQNLVELSAKVGKIDVQAPPSSRVTVDGRQLGEYPKDPVPVPPGRHIVEATFEGRVKSVSVDCTAGATTPAKIEFGGTDVEPPHEEPREFWTLERKIALGVGGAALVAGGVGLVFQLRTGSRSDAADATRAKLPASSSACNPAAAGNESLCSQLASQKDQYNSASTLRTVFLVSGAGLLVGGAALFVFGGPWSNLKGSSPSQGSLSIVPIVPLSAAREGGVALTGSF